LNQVRLLKYGKETYAIYDFELVLWNAMSTLKGKKSICTRVGQKQCFIWTNHHTADSEQPDFEKVCLDQKNLYALIDIFKVWYAFGKFDNPNW